MTAKDAKHETKATTYGRPRLLTHEEILDAAVEMGLETLTMKRLATSLGVPQRPSNVLSAVRAIISSLK